MIKRNNFMFILGFTLFMGFSFVLHADDNKDVKKTSRHPSVSTTVKTSKDKDGYHITITNIQITPAEDAICTGWFNYSLKDRGSQPPLRLFNNHENFELIVKPGEIVTSTIPWDEQVNLDNIEDEKADVVCESEDKPKENDKDKQKIIYYNQIETESGSAQDIR